jgi:Uma2 family endonuclease
MAVEILKRRFTADDYQRMGQTGILSEDDRVELIDGEVVAMTPIGPRHSACIDRTNRALVLAAGENAIVRVQSSVRLDRYNEPEPDVVLLRPQADFYVSRIPGPGDILLIVEVADSSIEYDRQVKAPLYATANVPEYWVADLIENVVWCYSYPAGGRYQTLRRHDAGESLVPALLRQCEVAVDVLLCL